MVPSDGKREVRMFLFLEVAPCTTVWGRLENKERVSVMEEGGEDVPGSRYLRFTWKFKCHGPISLMHVLSCGTRPAGVYRTVSYISLWTAARYSRVTH